MFLHLPIAVLATLSPIPVSDAVPKFDAVRECNFEGGASLDLDRCSRDEAAALRQLQEAWSQYAGADRKACTAESAIGGFASYVELLTCLEMASYSKNANDDARSARVKSKLQATPPGSPGPTVGIGHGPTGSRDGR
jgi:hypothetical protein